jgi:hypothetical protein
VSEDNGVPVRRAVVDLLGVPDSERHLAIGRVDVKRQVETDNDGRFEFGELPAGSYMIIAMDGTGFVPLNARRDVILRDGQSAQLLIRLPPTGMIVGRVEDEHGEPVTGAQVQALRKGIGFGKNRVASSAGSPADTDDRGRFRLFNLPAGEYYVAATYARSDRLFVRSEGSPEHAPRSGYTWTYHPHSVHPRDARVVVVRPHRESRNVDVTLRPCRLATVRIAAMDSGGRPLGSQARATLNAGGDTYFPYSMRYADEVKDGAFLFAGVPPGEYFLVVWNNQRMDEATYVPLTVNGEDVSLAVQTNTGARVSGRVTVTGPPGSSTRRASVSAIPPPGTYGPTYVDISLADVVDGRFELTGLRGPMVLHAAIASGALVSMRRGSEDIAGKTLEFTGTEAIDDVEVVVTTAVASLDVSVVSTRPPDRPEQILIVLFSDDPAKWHAGYLTYSQTVVSRARRSRGAVPGHAAQRERAGTPLRLIRMVPGRYHVVAIPDPRVNYPTDRRLLERLRPLATPVTLVAGQTAHVALRVTPFTP